MPAQAIVKAKSTATFLEVAGQRVREDAARVQDRAETASRIVRNLLAALPGAATTAQRFDVNRLVEDVVAQRQPDLASGGIEVRTRRASRGREQLLRRHLAGVDSARLGKVVADERRAVRAVERQAHEGRHVAHHGADCLWRS